MSNNKQSSVIDQAITKIEEKIIQSRTDNATTRRTGDYRIGLNEAKNILESLKAMHEKEIKDAYEQGDADAYWELKHNKPRIYKDQKEYYNETFNNNGTK